MIVAKHQEYEKVPIVPDFRRLSEIGGKVYNPEENHEIYYACIGAARFMENYGKAPTQPQIDTSHYFEGVTQDNDNPEPSSIRKQNIKKIKEWINNTK